MPEESDAEIPVESADQGPDQGKTPVWAICHVGGSRPPVKIFDTRSGVADDIRYGRATGFFLRSITCMRGSHCK